MAAVIGWVETNWQQITGALGLSMLIAGVWKAWLHTTVKGTIKAWAETRRLKRAIWRAVEREMIPNHGTSMKDQICALSKNQKLAADEQLAFRDEIRAEIMTLHINQAAVKAEATDLRRLQQVDAALLRQAIADSEGRIVDKIDKRRGRGENSL